MRPRFLWALLLLALLAGPGVSCSWSHGGHAVISQEEAVTKGQELVSLLVGRGKIPPTWASAALERASLELVEGLEEWHLVFRNDAESDDARRRLFVFLNYDGQVLAANFSGQTN